MSHTHTYRRTTGFIAVLFLMAASVALADEGKRGMHPSTEKAYGEYFDSDFHGVNDPHAELRGHEKGHRQDQQGGHDEKHGSGKKYGHHTMHGDPHHHAFSLHTLKHTLDLTDSQVDALQPVEADYKKAVIRKQAEVRIAEIDLGFLIDSPNPERGTLQTIVDSIGRLNAELMMARIDAFLKVKKELTAEQQKEFSKMVHAHMMGHGTRGHHGTKGRHGKMGHHGMGR